MSTMSDSRPANGRVLVIAGSDSSGGAGLEADQKVIAAHGCYATTATAALTAQNTLGVDDIHEVPPSFTRKQIDAVVRDMEPSVVKTGMLASAAMIDMVAKAVVEYNLQTVVVDPVMVATTGAKLLAPDAVKELRTVLLPVSFILTPNIPEAKLLLSDAGQQPRDIQTVDDLEVIARQVQALGPKWVLIKGGHIPFKDDGTVANLPQERKKVVDVLFGEGRITRIESAYQDTTNTHGTGCSLASAIASNLSKGLDPIASVKAACRYIEAGIRTAPGFGKGNGPLNHFHSTYTLPFVTGHFIDYLLERPDVAPVWHEFINHPFVLGLGSGDLPLESFKGYLIQDYLFLIQFARANALASYKSSNCEDIGASAKAVFHITNEMTLHLDYCKDFGITKEEVEATEEHQACTAYTRYVLDVGQSQDSTALQLALAPCLLGYGALAKQLHADPRTKIEGNIYWKWILNYVGDDYNLAIQTGSELIEKRMMQQSPARIEELAKIFIHATKMEIGFWEMFPSS